MPSPAIDYRQRVSKRAKYLQFRLLQAHRPPTASIVEIIIPLKNPPSERQIQTAKKHKQAQINAMVERAIERLELSETHVQPQDQTHEQPGPILPEHIDLTAIGKRIQVHYLGDPSVPVSSNYLPLPIRRPLALELLPRTHAILRDWLKHYARPHLAQALEEQAQRLQMPYQRLSVRLQKTRWGSRSSRGTISLNAALLLLRPEQMRYILIHELCHSQEMNHSPRFWAQVQRYDPNYQQHRAAIRRAEQQLPAWVRPD